MTGSSLEKLLQVYRDVEKVAERLDFGQLRRAARDAQTKLPQSLKESPSEESVLLLRDQRADELAARVNRLEEEHEWLIQQLGIEGIEPPEDESSD